MKQSKKTRTRNFLYEQEHYGDEPVISRTSSSIDLIHAYNWYGHFHVAEDAKKFVLDYFKKEKKKAQRRHIYIMSIVAPFFVLFRCSALSSFFLAAFSFSLVW